MRAALIPLPSARRLAWMIGHPIPVSGAEMDLVTPSKGGATDADSHGVVSTDVLGDDGYTDNGCTKDFGGTSASSPIASGVAGLILSANLANGRPSAGDHDFHRR